MTLLEGFPLSERQREVLIDASPRILVSAGAGSGKTRLLVAYFVQALLDRGVPTRDLVAVTFTRKAAAELADRIREELIERGHDALAQSLDLSTIGTIHSLCRRLIKEHAFEAVVDPAFSVMEAEVAAMVKQEISEQVWALCVEEAGERELGVLARYQAGLRRSLVPVYDRLRAAGQERPCIPIVPLADPVMAVDRLAEAITGALEVSQGLDKRSPTLERDLCRLEDCLGWLEAIPAVEALVVADPKDIAAVARAGTAFFPRRGNRIMEEWFGPVRGALTECRNGLSAFEGQALVEAMNTLLGRFHDSYAEKKRLQGALDFSDLELKALALVRARAARGESFFGPRAHVLIDEFQDTNEVQCAILENLGAPNMLMVGDERQSIYRFRGADVEVFRRREAELTAGRNGCEPAAEGCDPGEVSSATGLHRLSDNYRSSASILSFVNRLFAGESFFGLRFFGLDHARNEDGHRLPPDQAVDVLVVERDAGDGPDVGLLAIQEAEARVVAERVQSLIEKEGWEPRDIAVLTPALTRSDALDEALSARGVDTYLVRGKGYYSREEVADVRALLRVLVNPHDDLAFVTVSRSPLVGLTDDALYLPGKGARGLGVSLWEAARCDSVQGLSARDGEALALLVKRLSDFAGRVGRSGLALLIDDLVSEFSYDLCALGSDGGDRRFANIRKLMRLADQYESVHGPDLAGFAALTQSMGDLTDSEGNAPTLAEGENVVRIMTVHQAKGLEFKVVVLTGLGSNPRIGRDSEFVVASDGRVGVFIKGTRQSTYEEEDLCWGPAVEIVGQEKTEDFQEDLRLLYVAMTRAQDRLVLVGATPRGSDPKSNRIGRIVTGLGLDGMPAAGESVRLDGLDAVVTTVAPSDPAVLSPPVRDDAYGASGGEGSLEQRPDTEEACPTFLDLGRSVLLPRRLSFSSLAAFHECPRRFYLERVLGLKFAPSESVSPLPADGHEEAGFSEENGGAVYLAGR